MWTRSELKTKGKAALRGNYWRSVLVSLIMLVVLGGSQGLIGIRFRPSVTPGNVHNVFSESEETFEAFDDFEDMEDMEDYIEEHFDTSIGIDELDPSIFNQVQEVLSPAVLLGIAIVVFVIILLAAGIAIVLAAFIGNPILVGCSRFFVNSLNQPARVGEIGYAFDHNFMNVVKTMFLRDLYTFLWGLLLIIPGIVKSYEYRMIPYILAENPDISTGEAFALSKAMMTGQKWSAFVLDLSFIGWEILSLFTAGLLHIFYVGPYRELTNAALYETLAYGAPKGELTTWTEY